MGGGEGAEGVEGAEGAEGVVGEEGGEDWGVSESIMGDASDSDSEGEMDSDSDPLESHWSNPNTSYSVMSKSCPAPEKRP